MRRQIPTLALSTLSLALFACSAEPVPSTGVSSQSSQSSQSLASSLGAADMQESNVSSTKSSDLRIPRIDQQAPRIFRTATFALG